MVILNRSRNFMKEGKIISPTNIKCEEDKKGVEYQLYLSTKIKMTVYQYSRSSEWLQTDRHTCDDYAHHLLMKT